jgi:hypothetical protein
MMIVLRLLHIGLGVFWAGSLVFLALFLEPSVRAAMPESGKVMQQLAKRRLLDIMPVVALVTILTGIELFRRVSGNFDVMWLHTPNGLALAVGGIAAIVGFGVGMLVMRPAQLKAMALGPQAAQAEGAEKERLTAQAQAERDRARTGLRWVASLLTIAVVLMAVARYL